MIRYAIRYPWPPLEHFGLPGPGYPFERVLTEAHHRLAGARWPNETEVRIGRHAGDADLRSGLTFDIQFGTGQCARITALEQLPPRWESAYQQVQATLARVWEDIAETLDTELAEP